MSATPSGLGEFDLIERFFAVGHQRQDVALGIGDDAAVLEIPSGCDLVAAVDTIIEGRHFLAGTHPRSIGHRALAVNLSDIAAMGATPAWATLALTLPRAEPQWLQDFSEGFLDLARAYEVCLVGGDTTRGFLTISVQIMGTVPHGAALKRSGAAPGDKLLVTGTLGDAGAGLHLSAKPLPLRSADDAVLIRRFEYPEPRVRFGIAARGVASAAMDVSDGLVADLPKLSAASGVAAHVHVECLPLSAALRAMGDEKQSRDWALAAGDDYELLLAVSPARLGSLREAATRLNLTLTEIGELRSGAGVTWSWHGHDFTPEVSGYDHFPQKPLTQITV